MTVHAMSHGERFALLSEALASSRGLTDALRGAARALDASLVVSDHAGATVAVAARSPADERALLAGGGAVVTYVLRRDDRIVGRLGLRPAGGVTTPPGPLVRVARTLIAAELERRGARERAALAEEAALVHGLLAPVAGTVEPLVARAAQHGVGLLGGAAVVLVRARRAADGPEDWDARLLLLVRRATRAAALRSLAATLEPLADASGHAHVAVVVPVPDEAEVRRAAAAIERGLARAEPRLAPALGHSRRVARPGDLRRAGREAALAVRLAGSRDGSRTVAFADTGAYRLLLSFPRTGRDELRRFYRDTVEPLVVHDAAHRTDFLETLQTFLECDGSFARAGRRLNAHRHTVRYRLERVRDLTGLDTSSTSGREQLGLGLKAMRVLEVYAARR